MKSISGEVLSGGYVSLFNGKTVAVVDNTSTWFPMNLNGLTACPVVHNKELIQTTSNRVLKKYHIFYRNCTLISALLYWVFFVVYVCVFPHPHKCPQIHLARTIKSFSFNICGSWGHCSFDIILSNSLKVWLLSLLLALHWALLSSHVLNKYPPVFSNHTIWKCDL